MSPPAIKVNPLRLLRLGLFAMILVPLLLMIFIAWEHAYFILHVPCKGDFANLNEEGFTSELVTFTSQDGTERRGWFTPGTIHRESAIIVMPGHASNTRFA